MIRSGAVAYHDALAPMMAPIDECHPHPENDNNGDLEAISHSFETNGMYDVVKVQHSTGHIIAGNHTWEVAKMKGATICPQVRIDCDDTTARRILLDDNHTARLARKNVQQTLDLLAKIQDVEGDIASTSYTDFDLKVMVEMAEMPLTFEHASWPTVSFQLHPNTLKAFYHLTREADTDRDRFEVLLRLAGGRDF